MPFVLDGERGGSRSRRGACGTASTFRVDRIRQEPVIDHVQEPSDVKIGTVVRVAVAGFSLLNPGRRRSRGFYKSPTTTPGSTRT